MHLVGFAFRRACHPRVHVIVAVVAVCRNSLVGTVGGPILALFAQIGLKNTTLTL